MGFHLRAPPGLVVLIAQDKESNNPHIMSEKRVSSPGDDIFLPNGTWLFVKGEPVSAGALQRGAPP